MCKFVKRDNNAHLQGTSSMGCNKGVVSFLVTMSEAATTHWAASTILMGFWWYKPRYIHPTDYSSIIKKEPTWMNLKGIVLSEEKPVSKGYIPHGSSSWPNYRDAEMIRAGVGWGTSGTRKMSVTLAEKQERVPWGASSWSWPWWWLHKSTQGIKCHGRYIKTHKNKATWTCVKMGNQKKGGGNPSKAWSPPPCIAPNDVLALITHVSCHHWQKLGEGGCTRPLGPIFETSCASIIILK